LGKLVALGEVVLDIYRNEGQSPVELPFTTRPGGAPANVAVATARLGQQAAFVGGVGTTCSGPLSRRP
jgi:sugar/nucleoside kinase (ribokinase family)